MYKNKIDSPLLIDELKNQAGLTDEEIGFYFSLLKMKLIKKKDYFLQEGDICTDVAYVNKGCLSRYIIDQHIKEIIINFSLEDYWIGDLESLILQKPTIYFIQALEDSELLLLSRENLLKAQTELPKFKKFHDDKIRRNHYYTLKRLSFVKSATPKEKYLALLKEKPEFFDRIPLHHIASYLGIEPESLSRLRKRIFVTSEKS
jgi:CRP-like cAMP-binding protein